MDAQLGLALVNPQHRATPEIIPTTKADAARVPMKSLLFRLHAFPPRDRNHDGSGKVSELGE